MFQQISVNWCFDGSCIPEIVVEDANGTMAVMNYVLKVNLSC
jgi:hypothetical protein